MDESRWDSLRPCIADFHKHLSATCPPLVVIQATDKTWTDEEYKMMRPDGFPSQLRGVYLLYDATGTLNYIGSTFVNFDKRVWTHEPRVPRRWIDIIPLSDDIYFLAPALELFLISKLHPPYNTDGRGYVVPTLANGE